MRIFVDIDGTITTTPGSGWGPIRQDVLERVRQAIKDGHEVVVWSARGRDYVQEFCAKYKLRPTACISKPDVLVDDFVERKGPGFRDAHRLKWLTPQAFVQWKGR